MPNQPLKAALVYDFDGTLAAGNLPEHSFLPTMGIADAKAFWDEVKKLTKERDADEVLTYMSKLLEIAHKRGTSITREMLREHGRTTPLFEGLADWFQRINEYAAGQRFALEHYVISSGIGEMIEGCSIFDQFKKVFACSYAYDAEGKAIWPASAINYTNKTQFLFRINKGIMNTWDNSAINKWQLESERPVSFKRMIFLGDGETDIPSMKMVRHQGGQAVAVFDPEKWKTPTTKEYLARLIAEDRVDYVAPADFKAGSLLDITVRGILGRMALRGDHREPA